MQVQTPISLIFGIILIIILVVWFKKSKTNLRRLVVVFTGFGLMFFGLILHRIEDLDFKKHDILNNNAIDIPSKTELINNLNLDLGVITYSIILCVIIAGIVYLEANNKK